MNTDQYTPQSCGQLMPNVEIVLWTLFIAGILLIIFSFCCINTIINLMNIYHKFTKKNSKINKKVKKKIDNLNKDLHNHTDDLQSQIDETYDYTNQLREDIDSTYDDITKLKQDIIN